MIKLKRLWRDWLIAFVPIVTIIGAGHHNSEN